MFILISMVSLSDHNLGLTLSRKLILQIMTLLHRGNQNRTTEPTRANETSSRSHAILQVCPGSALRQMVRAHRLFHDKFFAKGVFFFPTLKVSVEYKVKHDSHYVCRTGKLSLIDLAGSERALATDQRTIRSLEGANINRSLLALSSCINALVEGKRHIPFRNSKLTQLLKVGSTYISDFVYLGMNVHRFLRSKNFLRPWNIFPFIVIEIFAGLARWCLPDFYDR